MIVVTGGAGFVGSNLVFKLNAMGFNDILIVEKLSKSSHQDNLLDCQFRDIINIDVFLSTMQTKRGYSDGIQTIFHQGANTDTTDLDKKAMFQDNYDASIAIMNICLEQNIPLIYASSASVYGDGSTFVENPDNEVALNPYAESKIRVDNYFRSHRNKFKSQVVSLRYFNVYGPREKHKGSMASMVYQLHCQLKQGNTIKLFEGSGGYESGEQRRDFIYIDDVIKANIFFMQNPKISGVFNIGTGRSQTFNEVATAIIKWHGHGEIKYIPFPPGLKDRYQSYTQSDLSLLRQAGYVETFFSIEEGVNAYLDKIETKIE